MRIETGSSLNLYVCLCSNNCLSFPSLTLSHSLLSSSRLCVCTSLQVCRGCPCSLDSSPTWCFRSMTGTSWSPSPTLWPTAHPYFSSHTSFSLDRYQNTMSYIHPRYFCCVFVFVVYCLFTDFLNTYTMYSMCLSLFTMCLYAQCVYMYMYMGSSPTRGSDCLGCAVFLCLVCLFELACFFLCSFSSLI